MYFAFKVHNKIVDWGGATGCIGEFYRYLSMDHVGIDKLSHQTVFVIVMYAKNKIGCNTLGVYNVAIKFRALYGLPK